MKNFIQKSTSLLLILVCVFCLAACGNSVAKEGLWKDAIYLEDTTLGDGDTALIVEVKAGEQSVTFTVNTNKETVGAALSEHNLIEGENGLYTKVNGITADYNVDNSYWSFYVNDAYANEGMDTTKIEKDTTYKLEYTK
ncbi:MAG: DUF4430 domain-containing protein [Ruminococcaceae bacterium]|nr:DUF4430 domain-containing protein [Oscillospiraceae bacterium]